MENNGQHNGNGHDKDAGTDNVVHIPTLAERDRLRREQKKQEQLGKGGGEPLINLPPVTKWMLGVMIGIHVLITFILDPPQQYWVYEHLGFIPAWYTRDFPGWPAFVGPFSYMLVHGNALHITMNGVMLAAFGAGVERWMGGRRMLILFVLCGLAAALIQFALSPFSDQPMIGASGGVSGLFAAVLLMLQSQGRMGAGGRRGILPFIVIWVAISIIFGLLGAPDGSPVAWAAHIGGFLAGFIFFKPVMRIQ